MDGVTVGDGASMLGCGASCSRRGPSVCTALSFDARDQSCLHALLVTHEHLYAYCNEGATGGQLFYLV